MTTPEPKPSYAGELWELKRHFQLQLTCPDTCSSKFEQSVTSFPNKLWAEREESKRQEVATLKRQALHKTLALLVCIAFLSVHLKPCLFLLRQGISDFTRSGALKCDPPTVVRGLLLASQ